MNAFSSSLVAASDGWPVATGDAGVHPRRSSDVGLDPAGVHAGGADARAGELEVLPQGLGEAAYGELAGVVAAHQRLRGEAEDARDVDHVSRARGLEVGEERLGAVDDAPEVHAHDPAVVLGGERRDGARQRDAGVVEDEVRAPVVGDDGVGPGGDGCLVGDVDHRRGETASPAGEQPLGLGETVGVDVGQREVAALGSQLQGQRAADAGARSGDGGDLVGQVLHARLLVLTGCRSPSFDHRPVSPSRGSDRLRPWTTSPSSSSPPAAAPA